eukprot:TRINITY_DN2828_c0_g1_i2.p1 TRINITY_DN2828_c0_g1~~TRINITY_DN2828_c0_g1_i2.p1  ORF type:complete len:138 (-),score=10.64 TRINITY_DN2828_c0_g1_i2:132-545(-)
MVGISLFVVGLAVEGVADIQKYRHWGQAKHQWISHGLWAYSRHPNYAGEITLWLGLSLMSLGGSSGLSLPWQCIVIPLMTPMWSMLFLLFTSLMLLEKRADHTWGGRATYEAYKYNCLLYTSPSPRDRTRSRMPSSA